MFMLKYQTSGNTLIKLSVAFSSRLTDNAMAHQRNIVSYPSRQDHLKRLHLVNIDKFALLSSVTSEPGEQGTLLESKLSQIMVFMFHMRSVKLYQPYGILF